MNAVEFEHVSKTYAIYEKPSDRLVELVSLSQRPLHREFHALSDVTFSVGRGEVFCIVGENGSGKSTALQIMAGILQPASGSVRVAGRVAALLELGAGFNPEFSGRDNVFLNASIMGLSRRETDLRFPDIENFAEIGTFIDQPVKTYSSGMAVRLAFAVAINLDPEILIVDEALAVGDSYFRHRCMRKVQELRARGVTIVFVSHSAADIQAIGDRVLWLEHGRTMALGDAGEILPQYLKAMAQKEGRYVPQAQPATTLLALTQAPGPEARAAVEPVTILPHIDHRSGDGRALILGIAVLNEYEEPIHLMMPNTRIIVRISVQARDGIPQPVIGFVLRNHLGLDFSETTTAGERQDVQPLLAGETCTLDFHIDLPELYPGAFSFSPSIADGTAPESIVCDRVDNAITVQMGRGEGPVYGFVQFPCRIEITGATGETRHA